MSARKEPATPAGTARAASTGPGAARAATPARLLRIRPFPTLAPCMAPRTARRHNTTGHGEGERP